MTPVPLVIENLSFRYHDRQGTAIHDISFEAKAGEVLLIAGARGCGKTMLLYTLEMRGRVMDDRQY